VVEYLQALINHTGLEADYLMVNCGLHDIKRDPETLTYQVELKDYEQNLHAIITLSKTLKTQLVWIRTTPCDEKVHNTPGKEFFRFSSDVHAYNQTADTVMQEAGIPIIDLYTFTQNLGPELYCDHVHFLDTVRQQQAAFLAGWLEGYISSRG